MTIEKRFSIRLQDILAVQFRCNKCHSVLSQTSNLVMYKCNGCPAEWHKQEEQEYMIEIGNLLKTLDRLRNKKPNDPDLEIALEFKE
jgi:hypothetical protein